MSLLKKLSPFYTLTLFYIIVSLVLRVVLLFHPITQASFSGIDTLKIFTIGMLSDSLVFIVLISTVKFDFDIVSRGNVSEVSSDSLTSASYF